ncbi:MAG TPA: nitrate reductase cytochrome c-type subunit [Gammaproteobacteria bacterium]|nr:nitrate reductase cytochrome c-type subunit [Gammaproteobacteria bacterium]
MKKLSVALVLWSASGVVTQFATAADVESLRGQTAIEDESRPPEPKKYAKDGEPLPRDYVQQPPLIPHKITNYRIDANSNKCLSCHSWKNYREAGATKISQTHFQDRDENVLANISARRYFCTQCHVPQANARPLVENTFKPITAISGQ